MEEAISDLVKKMAGFSSTEKAVKILTFAYPLRDIGKHKGIVC